MTAARPTAVNTCTCTRRGAFCFAPDCIGTPTPSPLRELEKRAAAGKRTHLTRVVKMFGRHYGWGSVWASDPAPMPAHRLLAEVLHLRADLELPGGWDRYGIVYPGDCSWSDLLADLTIEMLEQAGYALVPVEQLTPDAIGPR